MLSNPTFPGVYVEELSSGVHAITGVATSITAFLGRALSGPTEKATHVLSFTDYVTNFGGLAATSEMSYAVNNFFINGGSDAWIVNLAPSDASQANHTFMNAAGTNVLTVTAINTGSIGKAIEVQVDYQTKNADKTFNLTLINAPGGKVQQIETFTELSMQALNPSISGVKQVESAINGTSQLVTVKVLDLTGIADPGAQRPTPTPTYGTLTSGTLAASDLHNINDGATFLMQFGTYGPDPVKLQKTDAADLSTLAKAIQSYVVKIKQNNPAYKGFTCVVIGQAGNQLLLTSGARGKGSTVVVAPFTKSDGTSDGTAAALKLLTAGGATETDASQVTLDQGGSDGAYDPNNAYNMYIGDPVKHTGIYSLDIVDLFNILCLPGVTDPGILQDVAIYCKQRRAFLLIDPPPGQSAQDMYNYIESVQPINLPTGENGTNAAVYYPLVTIADPLNNGNAKNMSPSGMIAGIYAATDAARGVWKAPAGTNAALAGAIGLERLLTDNENGVLNPVHVNCLRIFPGYGTVVWGARTLAAPDDSDNLYIPVRRTELFLEESLYRGLKWVVFEPNAEPLWASIRLNVGAFMHDLFRKGAFQGLTPNDAYLVKCDNETTTPTDINNGIVNILVGFAPLKPAEFVILQIEQLAGQIQV